MPLLPQWAERRAEEGATGGLRWARSQERSPAAMLAVPTVCNSVVDRSGFAVARALVAHGCATPKSACPCCLPLLLARASLRERITEESSAPPPHLREAAGWRFPLAGAGAHTAGERSDAAAQEATAAELGSAKRPLPAAQPLPPWALLDRTGAQRPAGAPRVPVRAVRSNEGAAALRNL